MISPSNGFGSIFNHFPVISIDFGRIFYCLLTIVIYTLALRYILHQHLPTGFWLNQKRRGIYYLSGKVNLKHWFNYAYPVEKSMAADYDDDDDDDGDDGEAFIDIQPNLTKGNYRRIIAILKSSLSLALFLVHSKACWNQDTGEFQLSAAASPFATMWGIILVVLVESYWFRNSSLFTSQSKGLKKEIQCNYILTTFSVAIFVEAEYQLYLAHEANKAAADDQARTSEVLRSQWRNVILTLCFMLACGFTSTKPRGDTLKSIYEAASPFSKLTGAWLFYSAQTIKAKMTTIDDIPDVESSMDTFKCWEACCEAFQKLSSPWSLQFNILWLFRYELLKHTLNELLMAVLDPVKLYFDKAILDSLFVTDLSSTKNMFGNILWAGNCHFISSVVFRIVSERNRKYMSGVMNSIDKAINCEKELWNAGAGMMMRIKDTRISVETGKPKSRYLHPHGQFITSGAVISSYNSYLSCVRSWISLGGRFYLLYRIIGNSIVFPFLIFATEPLLRRVIQLVTKNKRKDKIQIKLNNRLKNIQQNMVYKIKDIKLLGWGSKYIKLWKKVETEAMNRRILNRLETWPSILSKGVNLFALGMTFGTHSMFNDTPLTTSDYFTIYQLITIVKKPLDVLKQLNDKSNFFGISLIKLGHMEFLTSQLRQKYTADLLKSNTFVTKKIGFSGNACLCYNMFTPEINQWPRDSNGSLLTSGPKFDELKQRIHKNRVLSHFKLTDINVEFPPHKLTVITGPNGCGKTTLLDALLGKAFALQGQVHFPFVSNKKGPMEFVELEDVAYLSQHPTILNKTIRENILFNEPMDPDRYKLAIDACDLVHDIRKFASRDLTIVGEHGAKLSGGQAQRLALARALYRKTSILVIDDCISAVDSITAKHIMKNAISPESPLAKGRTRIMTTNNLDICAHMAHMVISMDKGRIVKIGKPEEFQGESCAEDEKSRPVRSVLSAADYYESKFGTRYFGIKDIDWDVTVAADLAEEDELEEELKKDQLGNIVAGSFSETVIEGVKSTSKTLKELYNFVMTCDGLSLIVQNVLVRVFDTVLISFEIYWLGIFSRRTTKLKNMGPMMFICGQGVMTGLSAMSTRINIYLQRLALGKKSDVLQEKMVSRVIHSTPEFFHTKKKHDINRRIFELPKVLFTNFVNELSLLVKFSINTAYIMALMIITTPNSLVYIVITALIYSYIKYSDKHCQHMMSVVRSKQRKISRDQCFWQDTSLARVSGYKLKEFEKKIDEQEKLCRANSFKSIDRKKNMIFYSLANIFAESLITLILGMNTSASSFGGFVTYFYSKDLNSRLDEKTDTLSRKKRRGTDNLGFIRNQALTFPRKVPDAMDMLSRIKANGHDLEMTNVYLNIMQEAPAIIPSNRPRPTWPEAGAIKVENLSAAYDKYASMVLSCSSNKDTLKNKSAKFGKHVEPSLALQNISFEIKGGEKVGIIGRTGAGKSTLALTLMRFLEPKSGTIIIDGVDISKIGLEDLRSRVTIIPQNASKFNGSVRDNLDPFNEYTDSELWDILIKVGLTKESYRDKAMANNSTNDNESTEDEDGFGIDDSDDDDDIDGVESLKHKHWKKLFTLNSLRKIFREAYMTRSRIVHYKSRPMRSYNNLITSLSQGRNSTDTWVSSEGQLQLLTLARSVLRKSRVLIMDEPTANLDLKTDRKIQKLIRSKFLEGTTILCIAHRLKTIIDYDRILVIDDGIVIESDEPYNLLCNKDSRFYHTCVASGNFGLLYKLAKKRYYKKHGIESSEDEVK
ncbi:Transporter of the ATP-binding cassette (ABC) [Mycoemilia scoparia]|uniref:Transporter of the ATP-binding cassette (ABC) n=1 Tax=Mycoemilia scoparia TaxID=417184 RepID=A0A9W8A0W3_9FUNG|nr:Transporter of the ATP-binding cassette (ABC) [Mycoemilia scoparia]